MRTLNTKTIAMQDYSSIIEDTCPYCNLTGSLIGDEELLFECENLHIWSYHDCRYEKGSRHAKFIGWINYEDFEEMISKEDQDNYARIIKICENHDKFVRQKPRDVDYQDGTHFVWRCRICGEKIINMMSG